METTVRNFLLFKSVKRLLCSLNLNLRCYISSSFDAYIKYLDSKFLRATRGPFILFKEIIACFSSYLN